MGYRAINTNADFFISDRDNVGCVDLGTLNWNKTTLSTHIIFYSPTLGNGIKQPINAFTPINAICPKYGRTSYMVYRDMALTGTFEAAGGKWIGILDSSLENLTTSEFKQAMSGVLLFYQKATSIKTWDNLPDKLEYNYWKIIDETRPNQLVQNGNFESTSGWVFLSLVRYSYNINNNAIEITANQDISRDQSYIYRNNIIDNSVKGHKIVRIFDAEVLDWNGYETSNFRFQIQGCGAATISFTHSEALSKKTYYSIITASLSYAYYKNLYLQVYNGYQGMKWKFSNVMVIDLTTWYGAGNEPENVEQVEQDIARFKDEKGYIPYNNILQPRIIKRSFN